ncbi:MAG: hypothetical protein IPO23_09030 [Flavobacterium sp.]|nr:hypothetical protein [Flavobacterium sp.]
MEIINDILDFSKIESGKLELNIERIDLLEIANQVIDLFKNQAIAKDIDLNFAHRRKCSFLCFGRSIATKTNIGKPDQ